MLYKFWTGAEPSGGQGSNPTRGKKVDILHNRPFKIFISHSGHKENLLLCVGFIHRYWRIHHKTIAKLLGHFNFYGYLVIYVIISGLFWFNFLSCCTSKILEILLLWHELRSTWFIVLNWMYAAAFICMLWLHTCATMCYLMIWTTSEFDSSHGARWLLEITMHPFVYNY